MAIGSSVMLRPIGLDNNFADTEASFGICNDLAIMRYIMVADMAICSFDFFPKSNFA